MTTQKRESGETANNRVESARTARPTRKERCSLLAAHAERWAAEETYAIYA